MGLSQRILPLFFEFHQRFTRWSHGEATSFLLVVLFLQTLVSADRRSLGPVRWRQCHAASSPSQPSGRRGALALSNHSLAAGIATLRSHSCASTNGKKRCGPFSEPCIRPAPDCLKPLHEYPGSAIRPLPPITRYHGQRITNVAPGLVTSKYPAS
jgi:hypothetical protein